VLLCILVLATETRADEVQLNKKEIDAVESMLDSSLHYLDRNEPLSGIRWATKASYYLPRLKNNPFVREEIHTLLAKSLVSLGADREAITHWHSLVFHRKKALGYYDLKCAFKYGAIGSKFLRLNEPDSCFWAFRKAMKITGNLGIPVFYASGWNNLGMAYQTFGSKDSALICFFNALETLEDSETDAHLFKTSVYENIAQHYYAENRINEASFFYRKAIVLFANLPEVGHHYKANYYINLGRYLSKIQGKPGLQGVIDTAHMMVAQIPKGSPKYQALVDLLDIELIAGNAEAKDLLIEKNKYLELLNEAIKIEKDKAIEGLVNYKQALLQQQQDINRLELASKEESIQVSRRIFRNRVALLAALAMIILTALILIVILNKKRTNRLLLERKMTALEIENRRLEEEALNKELESKKSDIVDLALDNSRKLEFSKTVLAKLKEFQERENHDINRVIRKLEAEFNHQSNTESRISTLQSNVDKVNQAFYKNIKDQFEGLTQGELELCGYIRLKLSGKEIANLRNVNPDSITKAKQRLRKKLGLGPNADLYSFMQSV